MASSRCGRLARDAARRRGRSGGRALLVLSGLLSAARLCASRGSGSWRLAGGGKAFELGAARGAASGDETAVRRRQLLTAQAAAVAGVSRPALPSEVPKSLEVVAYEADSRLLYDGVHSRIFDTASRLMHDPLARLVPGAKASLLEGLPSQLVVCVGEEHNHPMHHSAELQLLRALRHDTPEHVPITLGLEMFSHTADQQEALEAFIFGSDDLEDLQRRVQWDKIWGWPMHHYAELLNYAKAHGIRTVGLDAPPGVSDFVEAHGIGGLLGRPMFPDVDLSDGAHRRRFCRERQGSAAALARGPAELQWAYEAQALREEWMAASLASTAQRLGGRLLAIAGRNHVAGRAGVPDRVHRRLGARGWRPPLTVILEGAEWDQHGEGLLPIVDRLPGPEEGDWIWYTERKKGGVVH